MSSIQNLFKENKFFFLAMVFGLMVCIAIGTIIFLRIFVFTPFQVHGSSMGPSYVQGDYIIVNELLKEYTPGDVIVFRESQNRVLIQRIYVIHGDEYTVVTDNGDNKNTKTIYEDQIIGKEWKKIDMSGFYLH